MSVIYQGEEKPITISIANDSTPETVADYQSIYAIAVNNRRQIAQYAYPETEGFELLELDAEQPNVIIIPVSQVLSKILSKGILQFELKITQSGGAKVVTKTAEIEVREALTREL